MTNGGTFGFEKDSVPWNITNTMISLRRNLFIFAKEATSHGGGETNLYFGVASWQLCGKENHQCQTNSFLGILLPRHNKGINMIKDFKKGINVITDKENKGN